MGEYYPPYARGMLYVLSEDLVGPLGDALFSGHIDPFPYREDVSVGLYILELARKGEVKVSPRQRKDSMPLDFVEHCVAASKASASPPMPGQSPPPPLLVLHRFRSYDAPCLWSLIEGRRKMIASAPASPLAPLDFCRCVDVRSVGAR